MGILQVQNFILWVFRGSRFLSGGYFVDRKSFPVGILWVQNFSCGYFVSQHFLPWVFYGSEIFSCRHFVGLKFWFVNILWVTCKYIVQEQERINGLLLPI